MIQYVHFCWKKLQLLWTCAHLSSFLSFDGLGNRMKGSIWVCWFHFQPLLVWWRSIAKLPVVVDNG